MGRSSANQLTMRDSCHSFLSSRECVLLRSKFSSSSTKFTEVTISGGGGSTPPSQKTHSTLRPCPASWGTWNYFQEVFRSSWSLSETFQIVVNFSISNVSFTWETQDKKLKLIPCDS